jgi:hypothetical protein
LNSAIDSSSGKVIEFIYPVNQVIDYRPWVTMDTDRRQLIEMPPRRRCLSFEHG